MQLTFENKTIDQLAIELIQAYNNPNRPYYGGFSGGIDSQIIYDLAKRADANVVWHYNQSPIDEPETRDFIKEEYPDVIWENYAQGFFRKLFLSNGLPLRTQRWCCGVIKECGGKGQVKILGMRKAESNARSGYQCRMTNPSGGYWVLPILDWSDDDRKQYIEERHLIINPVYKLGFTRTGCVLCPNQGKYDVALSLKYYPKIVNLWKSAADRYIKNRWADSNREKPTFKTGEEYFNWWIQRK